MRPSQAKTGGGGYLNNVTAMITGYGFTMAKDTEIKKGKRAGQTWSPVSFIPTFRVDGADEDLSSRFLVGDADRLDLSISDDGLTLTLGEGVGLFADNEAIAFIQSLINGGFPEGSLDDDPQTLNVEPIIGTRVRLEQVVNAEKTKNQGPQVGKNGKAYDRKDLQVAEVIELPTAKSKSASKPKAGAKVAKGVDVSELAGETLLEVLADEDGTLAFPKLKMKVFGKFGAKHPQRELRDEVLKFLGDSTNIAGIEGVEFDGKKQVISLA